MISTPWRSHVKDGGLGLAHEGGAGGALWTLPVVWPNLAPPGGFSQPWSSLGSCVSDACQLLLVLGQVAGLMCPVFITSVQRNRTVDVEMCKRFIMRNLLMRLWRLARPESHGVDQMAGDPAEVQRSSFIVALFFRRRQTFILLGSLTDWARPTHTTDGNLLYSKSTDLGADLIQKHSHSNI